jgi:hypothetical protein
MLMALLTVEDIVCETGSLNKKNKNFHLVGMGAS